MEISKSVLTQTQNVAIIFGVITAIIGLFRFQFFKGTPIQLFIILLIYTSVNELFCIWLVSSGLVKNNLFFYNIYFVINYLVLFRIYYKALQTIVYKKIVLLALSLYLLSFCMNMFFEDYRYELQSFPYIIGACGLIVVISTYFSELLKSEQVLYVSQNALFWISIGLLLFSVGYIPFSIVRNYYGDLDGISFLFMIIVVLSILMNIFFSIGLLWSNKKRPY